MPAHDATERALIARLAAHTRWAKVDDRTASTAPARQAAMERFERQVDPAGKLDPAERARRAESARKAFFTSMALKSAKARRLRRQADQLEDTAAEQFAELAPGEA